MGIFLFVFFISAISYTTCHPITDPIDILAKIPIEHHTNNTQLPWGNENTTLIGIVLSKANKVHSSKP